LTLWNSNLETIWVGKLLLNALEEVPHVSNFIFANCALPQATWKSEVAQVLVEVVVEMEKFNVRCVTLGHL
jgi:hypothetical protein